MKHRRRPARIVSANRRAAMPSATKRADARAPARHAERAMKAISTARTSERTTHCMVEATASVVSPENASAPSQPMTSTGGRILKVCRIWVWAVCTQTIRDSGKPQNKAERPRANLPSERSNSALGAVSGMLVSTFISFTPSIGVSYTLKALIVVIMAGLGRMAGTLGAGLLLGIVEATGGYLIDSGLTIAINFALFMFVLLLRPTGLFARG